MKRAPLFPLSPLFAVIFTAAGGCGSASDPGAIMLGNAPQCESTSLVEEAALTLGTRKDEVFTPFRQGDTLVIIDGPQGGTWVMPTLRLTGGSAFGTVNGSIVLAAGDEVGHLPDTSVHAEPVEGGELEVEYVPIPIADNPDGSLPPGIAGSEATVHLLYTGACGERGSLTLPVVLAYDHQG